MPEAFNPVTLVTTTTRSRDGEDSSNSVLRETTYEIQTLDQLVFTFHGVCLERGGYGDPYREIVRLNQNVSADAIASAITGLVCYASQEVSMGYGGEMHQARCWSLLRRVAEALPTELRQPAADAITSEVEA